MRTMNAEFDFVLVDLIWVSDEKLTTLQLFGGCAKVI